MWRQAVVLVTCVMLGVLAPASATFAGGRRPLVPGHGALKVQPEFRQNSAFGSPGGFPFPWQDFLDGQAAGQVARRMPRHHFVPPRHHFFPRFPTTTFFFTPAALYSPSVVDPSPPVMSVAPVVYVSPTVYVSPPVAPAPPAYVAAPPSPAPPQASVIEHPTGRYELRGDGLSTPYTWVWIPNPPEAPPAPREQQSAAETPSGQRGQTYRWTDDEGTTFWTNRLDSVPEPYRSRVQGRPSVRPPQ